MVRLTSLALPRRRTIAVVLVALLLVPVWLLVKEQTRAKAASVSSTVAASCSVAGITLAVSVPITVTDADSAVEGTQTSLQIVPALPTLPIVVTVNSAVITIPIPAEVASVDSVTFGPGNVTPSFAINGSNLVVTFTGPVSSDALQLPSITTVGTLKTGIAPTT